MPCRIQCEWESGPMRHARGPEEIELEDTDYKEAYTGVEFSRSICVDQSSDSLDIAQHRSSKLEYLMAILKITQLAKHFLTIGMAQITRAQL